MPEQRRYMVGYVQVQSFISDVSGGGIISTIWPDKRTITVFMDMETEKAANPRRPTFEELRTRGEVWHGGEVAHRLEEGGFLRLRLFPKKGPEESYTTDWPNVVTWNRQESSAFLRFGYGLARVYTPAEVNEKRTWLSTHPNGIARLHASLREHSTRHLNEAIEQALNQEMPGFERYRAFFHLYRPDHCMRWGKNTPIRDQLMDYFEQAKFKPFTAYEGLGYRPVKPHLIVRSLDEEDRVLSSWTFMPRDAEEVTRNSAGIAQEKRFLTALECTDKVLAAVNKGNRWDILPGEIYQASMEKMRMGEKNNANAIRCTRQIARLSRHFDEDGNWHPLVRRMGIKLAAGGSKVVVDTIYDPQLRPLSPYLLRSDRECYSPAPDLVSETEYSSKSARQKIERASPGPEKVREQLEEEREPKPQR